jgi:hypothetical protein
MGQASMVPAMMPAIVRSMRRWLEGGNMESHRIVQLWTDRDIDDPMQVIRGFLAQVGAGLDPDAICYHSTDAAVVRDYSGPRLSTSWGFFFAVAWKIALTKKIDKDVLDLDEMRLSEFSIPEKNCQCILMAVPVRG